MRTIAAYMLAVLGGNTNPSAADIRKILDSVGIDADDARTEQLLSKLKGKNIQDVIAAGKTKLAVMPAPSAGGAAPAAAPKEEKAAAKEEKKPAKKEESEEEDMGLGLFD
eukprot:EC713380.1.p1 GENE.EC713380.1~~EC713380.1.p1  ORF type:complete len:110 (+),score=50.16 EC713380.1:2-331(+)